MRSGASSANARLVSESVTRDSSVFTRAIVTSGAYFQIAWRICGISASAGPLLRARNSLLNGVRYPWENGENGSGKMRQPQAGPFIPIKKENDRLFDPKATPEWCLLATRRSGVGVYRGTGSLQVKHTGGASHFEPSANLTAVTRRSIC